MQVVIPTYNREKLLAQTVKSVIDSGVPPLSITVCPDHGDCPSIFLGTFILSAPDKKLGSYGNTVRAITEGFDASKDEWVVCLQDDTIVSSKWLDVGLEVSREVEHCGIISLWNRCHNIGGKWEYMQQGHPGGVCWMVNRFFWEEFLEKYDDYKIMGLVKPNDKRKNHFVYNLSDWKICHALHRMGWKLAITSRSYVQHMGDVSTITDRSMASCRSDRFVG